MAEIKQVDINSNSAIDSDMPIQHVATGPVNPLIQQGQPPLGQPSTAATSGMGNSMGSEPLAPPIASDTSFQNDDETGVDDVVWSSRAKRIIAGTRGDPHRQVQLLQQLSVVYLKERYGRSVHADEA